MSIAKRGIMSVPVLGVTLTRGLYLTVIKVVNPAFGGLYDGIDDLDTAGNLGGRADGDQVARRESLAADDDGKSYRVGAGCGSRYDGAGAVRGGSKSLDASGRRRIGPDCRAVERRLRNHRIAVRINNHVGQGIDVANGELGHDF